MRIPESVFYPESKLGTPLFVEKLGPPDVTKKAAREVLTLMLSAYAPIHEEPSGQLPQGTVRKRFDPYNDDLVDRQVERIAERNSQYWLLRMYDKPDDLLGLAKTTPSSKPGRLHYINDVAVESSRQHNGLGSVLLHSALKFGLESDRRLALEGYGYESGRRANAWYEKLGFIETARRDSEEGVSFGPHHHMPLVRYDTPKHVTVSSIVGRLEQWVPSLAEARPNF